MSGIIKNSVATVNNWWVFMLTGIAFIAASFWVLNTPVESFMVLAMMFSILIFVNGISTTIFTISNRKYLEGWGWMLAGGIFDIVFGAFMMMNHEYSMGILPMFVGFWILFRAVNLITASLDLKKLGFSQWVWLLILGILLSVVGLLMVFDPTFGFVNVIYLAFIGLFFMGLSQVIFGNNLRKIKKTVKDSVTNVQNKVKEGIDSVRDDILKNVTNLTPEEKKEVNEKFDTLKSLVD